MIKLAQLATVIITADEVAALLNGGVEAVALEGLLQLQVVEEARAVGVVVLEGVEHVRGQLVVNGSGELV